MSPLTWSNLGGMRQNPAVIYLKMVQGKKQAEKAACVRPFFEILAQE